MRKTKEWENGSRKPVYYSAVIWRRNKLTETHLSIRGNDVIYSVHLSDYEMRFAERSAVSFCFIMLEFLSISELRQRREVLNPNIIWFPFPLKGNRAYNYMASTYYFVDFDFKLIFCMVSVACKLSQLVVYVM